MTLTRGRIAALIGLALVGLLAAAFLLRPDGPATGANETSAPSGSATDEPAETVAPTVDEERFFAAGLFGFDIPAGWRYSPMDYSASFVSVFGYVSHGSFDAGTVCQTIANGSSCSFGNFAMGPGTAVMQLGNWAHPPGPADDPIATYLHPSAGEPVALGGVRAVLTRGRGQDGRLTLAWRIMRPDSISNWIQVDAEVLGPDEDALAAQVISAMSTFRYAAPLGALVPGDGLRVAAMTLQSLKQNQPDPYSCFPPPGGAITVSTLNLPDEGLHFTAATCRTTIVATDLGLWQVTLTIHWPAAADQASGDRAFTIWVTPDGSILY